MQEDRACYFCGAVKGLEKHHVWAGVAGRPISEANGFWCYLCHDHHTGPHGAQYDKDLNLQLKMDCQMAYEKHHSRREFMDLIGKNYLG